MKMKKMLALIAVGIMMSTGCGGGSTDPETTTKPSQDVQTGQDDKKVDEKAETNEADMKKIAIVQYVEHPSLDTIRESMIDELAEAGYVDGENIIIDYQNGQADQTNLNSIAGKFLGDQPDVVVAIATPAAQSVASMITDIPIVFSAVSDPVEAKLVGNMEKPTGNITGTSDMMPIDQTFELIKELTPNAKKIGFIYTASEANSQSIIAVAKEMAKEYGYEYEEISITSTSELQQAAASLASKVDVIYTPVDNGVASAMPVLAEVGKEAKVPVYVGADSMVSEGGYATVGVNYTELGEITGDMVKDILEGKQVSDIPVATLQNFAKVINKTTAEAIGATAELEGATIVE